MERMDINLKDLVPLEFGKNTPIKRKYIISKWLEQAAWEAARLRRSFKMDSREDMSMLVKPGPKVFTTEELGQYFRDIVRVDWVILYPNPQLLVVNKREGENG